MIKTTLCALLLNAAPAAAAVQFGDSGAARQAQTMVEAGAEPVVDGNSRRPARVSVDGNWDPSWSEEPEHMSSGPGPRVGAEAPTLREPANPMPRAAAEQEKPSGLKGFFGNLDWKKVGFAAGGLLLGVGLGMLFGFGWLGIAALAVGGAALGWFMPKLF